MYISANSILSGPIIHIHEIYYSFYIDVASQNIVCIPVVAISVRSSSINMSHANFILSGPIIHIQEIIMNDVLYICIHPDDSHLCHAILIR